MKKLITLLMLVTCGIGMGWAQTEVTATWNFDLGTEGQVATLNAESANSFYGTYVALGTNLYFNGKKSVTSNGVTYNQTAIRQTKKNSSPNAGTDNVDFMLYTKKGLKFKPTSVSFTATRYGTNGGKINVLWVNSDNTTKELGTGITPNRDNGNPNYTTYSYNITDGAESDGTCGLRIMIYGVSGKDYGLCNIKITGTISGTAEEVNTYNITTSTNPAGAGRIIQELACPTLPANSKVTFKAVANNGYQFLNKWTVNGVETSGATYTIESLATDMDVVAEFAKLPTISFAKPEGVTCINRAFPANISNLTAGSTYTLPYNYMYYKEGYTMTGWSDGTNNYNCGDSYTVTDDVTLTPIFTENTTSLSNHKQKVTVKYDFARQTNKGRYVNIEGNKDIFITTANVDGKDIDVKLDINCLDNAGIKGKRGKVNNISDDTKVQVNPGTVFTIPVEAGSVITITSKDTKFTGTTFNGTEGTYNEKIVTYTASTDGDVTVISTEDNMFYQNITVTYPSYTLAAKAGYYHSLYLDYNAVIPEGVTAYTGTLNSEETTINLTKINGNIIPANTGVVVKADAAGDKVFEETSEIATVDAGSLKGVLAETVATELAQESKVVLTLGINSEGTFGFRKPAGGKIGANKIYLLVSEAAAAKGISMSFDDETTGISEVNTENADNNAATYDLTGRRVNAGAKGLLIRNGKKFIVK